MSENPFETIPDESQNEMLLKQPAKPQEVAKAQFSMRGESEDRETYSPEDIALPFLTIIQDLSPQRKSTRAEFIEEAKTGDIFNTVSHELFKDIFVVPCSYQRRYVEWKPDRGGLVRDWGTDATAYLNASETDTFIRKTRSGNEIVSLATFYVLHLNGNNVEPAIISMGSTQWKKARRWNALLQNFQMSDDKGFYPAPIYARVFQLKTVHESKDQNDWFGWETIPNKLLAEHPNGQLLMSQAKALRKAVGAGTVKVTAPPGSDGEAYDPYGEQGDEPYRPNPTQNRKDFEDDIPF